MNTATNTEMQNERDGWNALDDKDFVSCVAALLCTDVSNSGFRNWFRDTYAQGYVPKGANVGAVVIAMLQHRLDYFKNL